MFGCLSRLIEFDYVGTLQFHQYLYLPAHHFFILDAVEQNSFDCEQLVFVVLHVASVDSSETAFSQLDGSDDVALDDLAGHL